MKRYLVAILLCLCTLAGGYLRFEGLNRQSYWMDEGYTVNAVLSGIQNGTERFAMILDSGERYFCPLYCLPTASLVRSLGQDPFVFRLLAAIFGLLTIPLAYAVSTRIFQHQRAAILAGVFTAFSYWHIAWSREARWYTELEWFFWLALLCFYAFMDTRRVELSARPISHRRYLWLLPASIFALAAILTHPIAYALPIIFLAWFLIDQKPNLKHAAIAVAAVIAFTVFVEVGLGLDFLTENAPRISLHNHALAYVSFYLRSAWIFIALGVYGYVRSDRRDRNRIVLLAMPFALTLIVFSFFTDVTEYRYLFHTTLGLIIIASFGAIRLIRDIRQLHWKAVAAIIIAALLLLDRHLILWPQPFYTLEADDPTTVYGRSYYAYTPQPDFRAAYETIRERLNPGDIVISSHPHFNKIFLNQAGYWLAYDYLRRDTPVPEEMTHERYVHAEVIHDAEELRLLMQKKHGYIVFDYMSTVHRIDPSVIKTAQDLGTLIFADEINSYSKIWVYRF